MEYIGEHLWPGRIGNFFIVFSFVCAFLATLSYFFATRNPLETSWKKLARSSFFLHSFSIAGIVGTLFYMLVNHLFEYQYVWQHSNTAMPMKYILSCFWEGQEGSFLLWMVWHVVLSFILMRKAGTWEAPVMTVVSLVQLCLSSMLLGIYLGDEKLGSNPFMLVRELPENIGLPWTKLPDYLTKVELFKDGRGLNPLLQNYWMTIHPPTLFLGFAATLVPFAYAIAGLWTRRYTEWQKPALPWTFFGIMILGTGILMGGAWAYEALSFGGFWAWDPVENASLVPWLTLVGAGHVMLVNKTRGESLFTSFLLTLITFIFILYSTYLTRSGVLAETSVHAFTDLGMHNQLLIYLSIFALLSIFLLVRHYRSLPRPEKEESVYSREFWMFIGALVLFISSFQIIFTTSVPVINKIAKALPWIGDNYENMAPPTDVIGHYNMWQVPFAIVVLLLMGIGLYFKYKKTDMNRWWAKMLIMFTVSVIISAVMAYFLYLNGDFKLRPSQSRSDYATYLLLLFAGVFSVVTNFTYIVRVMKGSIKKSGSAIAHIGFALLLLGALISTSRKEIISFNTSGTDVSIFGKEFSNNEDITLYQGDTLRMGEYHVVYNGRKKEGINILFEVAYFKKDADSNLVHAFTLHPFLQLNKLMGNVVEPDTRHYLDRDIYTHITYIDPLSLMDEEEKEMMSRDYDIAKDIKLMQHQTVVGSKSILIFEGLDPNIDKAKYGIPDSLLAVGARFTAKDFNNNTYTAMPIMVIRHNTIEPIEAKIEELGIKLVFWRLNPDNGEIEVTVSEKKTNTRDFIVMQAIVFPWINILWMGCIVMIIGTVIAIVQRIRTRKEA
jgi:cytochrome c-type biogenesis protein CcmF